MLQTCMFVSVMLRMEEEGLECWVEKEISNANPWCQSSCSMEARENVLLRAA